MGSREERLAQNEATAREINEGIKESLDVVPSDRYVRMVCECGSDSCDRLIAITIPEYERVRNDPRQFAVARDHVMAEVEQVVAETDRYVVVIKSEGSAAEVATEEDPRS